MAENMIKFLRGNVASLPQTATAGAVYFTKDEGLYLGLEDGTYHRYGDFITVANVAALPESGAHENCMYYCDEENILAKWDGKEWIQINKQKTLAELGGVAKSVYDAKMALLEKADTDNATAISDLAEYVGTIPADADVDSVIAYVDKKTAGIATDAALSELQGKVATAEGEIDTLQAAIAEGGSVATAIATAQAAAEAAQATADGKVTMGEVEAKGYQTAAQVQAIADGKDEAIAAAKSAADAAAELAGTKATMTEVNAAIAGAGHAVKTEVDQAIAGLETAYKAADTALETKLQGNIDKKVDQTAYDTKVAELAGKDAALVAEDERLAGLIADNADNISLNAEAIAEVKADVDAFFKDADMTEKAKDTLKEIQAYIDSDASAASEMTASIQKNAQDIAALDGEIGAAADGETAATGLYKVIADGDAALQGKIDVLTAADATNLQAAKDYADDAVEALGIGDYVKKADADVAYAAAGHNHDDKYDAKGAAADALAEAKTYADQAEADAVASAEAKVKALADGAVAANTAAIATKAAQSDLDGVAGRVTTAEGKITALETASATHALKTDVQGVQTALNEYKESNNAAVALKANAADVYAKTETFTKDEVNAAIEAAVTTAHTWGTF